MLHLPRTVQQPETSAGQALGRTANMAQRSRAATAVRLVFGTLAVAGTWLAASLGSVHTSLAKDALSQTATPPSRGSITSASYWQHGMISAASDQTLVGLLEWNTSDLAWSGGPAESVRHAEQALDRTCAETPPAYTPHSGDLLEALTADRAASPQTSVDLTAGLPTASVAVAANPAPVPDAQSAPPEATESTADLQPGSPILFDVLTTASSDMATVPAGPQALDMAGPLAEAHPRGAEATERAATAPSATSVARAETPASQNTSRTPLDTSRYVLPEALDSPAVPSEFLASRFGSAVPIVRLAQVSPTEGSSEDSGDARLSPADDSSAAVTGSGSGAGEDKALATAEKLGDEPASHPLEFLRTQTVLLKPCQWQVDVGLSYVLFEDDLPVVILDGGEVSAVVQGKVKERRLFVPLAVRYGWSKRTQLFCDVPLGWADTELSLTGTDEFDDHGGIGDIVSGATFLLRQCNNEDIVLTVAATFPTGGDPYDNNQVFQGAALGEGFWALSADVLCIKTIDPVAFFYGVGTRHSFAHDYLGSEIKPGGEYRYQLGVGLAINPRVTLSTRFAGSYVSDLRVNDNRVAGTLQEPMSIRMAATISQRCNFVEPFVEFGLTDDAAASYFGIVWTY